MEAVILKCTSGSRFHFGEYTNHQNLALMDTAEYIHSDVLFGAFISTVAQVCPDRLSHYKSLFETGKVCFSSGFYCIEKRGQTENNYIYLLPKPASLNLKDAGEDHKVYKRIKYISKTVWEKGIELADWFAQHSECVAPNSVSLFHNSELASDAIFKLAEKADNLKVRKHTTEMDANLYTQTDLVLLGNEDYVVHWYFLLDTQLPEDEKTELKNLIEWMASNGLGGERSTGCGKIDNVEFYKFELNPTISSSEKATLSMLIPKEEDIPKLKQYQIKKRGGRFLSSEHRLQLITAVLEGAIVSDTVQPQVINLAQSGQASWRYGGCLSLEVHKNHVIHTEKEQ